MEDLKRDDLNPDTNERNEEAFSYFKNFTRMSPEDFDYLQEAIAQYVKKQVTSFRPPIKVAEQLGVTLRFLATGDSYRSLSYLSSISHVSISRFMPKVCQALIREHDYFKLFCLETFIPFPLVSLGRYPPPPFK